MSSFKGLVVYKKAFKLAMEIFEITKSFPKEEVYSLASQIRRSQDQYARTLVKVIEKDDMKLILLVKSLMRIWKTAKLKSGSIFL